MAQMLEIHTYTTYIQMLNILINLQIEHFQISAELLPFL
jgi:hypothetical protein